MLSEHPPISTAKTLQWLDPYIMKEFFGFYQPKTLLRSPSRALPDDDDDAVEAVVGVLDVAKEAQSH